MPSARFGTLRADEQARCAGLINELRQMLCGKIEAELAAKRAESGADQLELDAPTIKRLLAEMGPQLMAARQRIRGGGA